MRAVFTALVRSGFLRYQMHMTMMRNAEMMMDDAGMQRPLRSLLLGLICDRRAR